MPPSYVTCLYLTLAAFAIASIALWPLELTPAVATLIWPGFARIASSSSATVLYGVFGLTDSVDTLATLRNSAQSPIFVSSMPSTA